MRKRERERKREKKKEERVCVFVWRDRERRGDSTGTLRGRDGAVIMKPQWKIIFIYLISQSFKLIFLIKS